MNLNRLKIALSIVALAIIVVTTFYLKYQPDPNVDKGISAPALHSVDSGNQYPLLSPENTLFINLKSGVVKIQLLPDVASNHVARIKSLANQGFYDGLKFHRVVDGILAQTGDPDGTGSGSSNLPDLHSEFTSKYAFERGVIGMARAQSEHSANSQFFIMLQDLPHLDGAYTIFGRVVDGMNLVDNIAKGEPPANPDKMIKMYFEQ